MPCAGHVIEIAAGADEQPTVFLASRRAADQILVLVHAAQCNRGDARGKGAGGTGQIIRAERSGRVHAIASA